MEDCVDLAAIELRAQVEQQLRVEAGADLAREDEIVSLEVTDEECAEPDSRRPVDR